MRRLDAVVELLDSHAGSRLRPGTPSDDALLELLGHMAIRDDVFDDAEIALLDRVLPDWNATTLHAWLGKVAATELDLDEVAHALSTDDQRWTALRFVARMAMADGHLDEAERSFLDELAEALDLGADAVDRVLGELDGPLIDVDRVTRILDELNWSAVDFAEGDVQSEDLKTILPAERTPVRRVGVDGAEVMGIYAEGIAARFLEGVTFLPWEEIVATSRGSGLETTVRMHTEDGRIWSLVDPRLGGIGRVLERLRAVPHRDPGNAPLIEKVSVDRAGDGSGSTWSDERDDDDE